MTSQAESSSNSSALRAPVALAAVAFAGGRWVAGHLDRPLWLWGGATALLVLCTDAVVLKNNVRLAQISAVFALLCEGALARVDAPVAHVIGPPPEFLCGEPVEIEGHVTSDGALLPGNSPRERFDLETETIQLGDRKFTRPVGIRASVFVRSDAVENDPADAIAMFPQLAYADRVRSTAKLRPRRDFRTPGAFDYEGYLRALDIS